MMSREIKYLDTSEMHHLRHQKFTSRNCDWFKYVTTIKTIFDIYKL